MTTLPCPFHLELESLSMKGRAGIGCLISIHNTGITAMLNDNAMSFDTWVLSSGFRKAATGGDQSEHLSAPQQDLPADGGSQAPSHPATHQGEESSIFYAWLSTCRRDSIVEFSHGGPLLMAGFLTYHISEALTQYFLSSCCVSRKCSVSRVARRREKRSSKRRGIPVHCHSCRR